VRRLLLAARLVQQVVATNEPLSGLWPFQAPSVGWSLAANGSAMLVIRMLGGYLILGRAFGRNLSAPPFK